MINPINFLWKQLNGPQITAYCQGIYLYFKKTYDDVLEYWKNFSIATANNSHLTFLGALQGIARPKLAVTGVQFFLFSEVPAEGTYYPHIPYTESDHGLSDIHGDVSIGGKFIDIHDDPSHHPQDIIQIPPVLFRQILKSSSESKAAKGSLAWLDDVLYGLWRLEHSEEQVPDYTFRILEEADLEQFFTRSIGDLIVNIGRDSGWTYAAEVIAELRLLGKTLYYPTPTLYATATAG